MAAHVLSLNEQKASLSGKKHKKKVIKNVLGLPTSVKVESHLVEDKEGDKLIKNLERLLLDARLPIQQNGKNKKEELTPEELKQKEEASKIRNQLALGVNDLNRSIKKELISAALVESEVQPKFLIHHINILCTHNKIPFLHLPGLRKVTKNSLGFPCIALGFKKDFTHFLKAINKIKSLAEKQNVCSNENDKNSVESDDSDILNSVVKTKQKDDETPFTYLHRTSLKERVFVPENCDVKLQSKPNMDFISIDKDDDETKTKEVKKLGISYNLIKKQKKQELLSLKNLEGSDSEEEDLYKVPKKKSKKQWVIDTVGTKPKFKYSPAKILKVHSNQKRIRRTNKQKP